jgi:aminodeoxychorismate lyase
MKVCLNGSLVGEEQAVISVFDRGFLYGDGLFETIAVQQGRLFRWRQHLARFERGAQFLKLSIPASPVELHRNASDLINANQIETGLLRITLSRGRGPRGYSPRDARKPTLVMTSYPAPPGGVSAPSRWRLIVSSFRVPAAEPLAAFKTCNKLPQILARAEAESSGADEALLLNTNGELAEAASSNLFWIEGQTICTTPLTSGILAGVMRELVLELCAAQGLQTKQTPARPATLHHADGVFLTMSSLGIVEAIALDQQELRSSTLVRQIYGHYREALQLDQNYQ